VAKKTRIGFAALRRLQSAQQATRFSILMALNSESSVAKGTT
jgi:hypothetical protein